MSIDNPATQATIAVLLAELRGHLSPNHYRQAEPLARQFLRRVAADELASRSSAAWVRLLLSLFEFVQCRNGDAAAVRVFNLGSDEVGSEVAPTLIEVVTDDMPFLVDSVGMAIARCGNLVHAIVHPVLMIDRDGGGNLLAMSEEADPAARGKLESIMHFEVERRAEPEELARLQTAVLAALHDVRAAVGDWAAMRARVLDIAGHIDQRRLPLDAAGQEEIELFLRWVADDHFTLLGCREYVTSRENGQDILRSVADSGLGLMRNAPASARPLDSLGERTRIRARVDADRVLIITKTNSRSTVHRNGYLDYIGILRFDESGRSIGESRFLGLFTSSAYTARPWSVPMLRRKYEQLIQSTGIKPSGHSGKALRYILETLPRDELLQAPAEELFEIGMGVLALQQRQRTRLFARHDVYGRFFSCLVYLPRDRFNQDVRERIETLLGQALAADHVDSNVAISEDTLARLHLVIRPRADARPNPDFAELEARITQIVRNWYDELRESLVQKHGEQHGLHLASHFGRALPAGYIEEYSTAVAVADVEIAASLRGADDIRIRLYRLRCGERDTLRFKLFRFAAPIELSEALPLMENMGLRVLSEHPFEMPVAGSSRIHIQDFEVQARGCDVVDVDRVGEAFQAAFEQIWRQQAESDGFNQLILAAGLDWRQVSMLRAYCKYLLQTGVAFSQSYMEQTLVRYPLIARLLAELFESRFDPAHDRPDQGKVEIARNGLQQALESVLAPGERAAIATVLEEVAYARGLDRDAQIDACNDALEILLDQVANLDEDRILRGFVGVIQATLRTNYWQLHQGQPAPYLCFKFNSLLVPELPKPRPYREIFVYSPRVEGVHLRFGPVARGGLRWSDRREDFRTEVLGLVKAQMVKNTVIVPVGAKGGFVLKRPPLTADRDALLAEGIACYRLFVNALLDITDNLVDGSVVNPQGVVLHDGDDPYLVVAADKGTATFSDIANEVSAAHAFWLGDAFASGGSQGYDHKIMGITAKGAWESVKRHFRAMGHDCQSEDFTVVGVGDMSGDVFGNGMLLSRHIRLLAAFDHRHIFIDPNPDAATSFAERERLFALPRSSWADYDPRLISAGGGVYPRTAKTIALSTAARAVLGIDSNDANLSPNQVLTAILGAPADLLWNGGIGTYVKAASESHADCGDRANNAIRINGGELRVKVIGEGGNLGMTQKGRIEAALAGVLLNTDFIDNSAGVDTSDHEVNIKILLNDAVATGVLDVPSRNRLLASMTEEVSELVLRDNVLQNQAISIMERMSVRRLGSKQHFIRTLEAAGQLDRAIEYLPSDAEFSDRKKRGLGLTRPELSILLSYSKIVLFNQMLASDVPEDPYLAKELVRYFPLPLQEVYREHMERHPLRREIIATAVTNSTVNRMGATFVMRMQEDTGAEPAQIAKAYSIAREVIDARALWVEIENSTGVHGDTQIDALLRIWTLLRHLTRWLLSRHHARLDFAEAVDRYAGRIAELRALLSSLLPEDELQAAATDCAAWQAAGLSAGLSESLSHLQSLASAFDVIEVALDQQQPLARVAAVYFGLGDRLSLRWLQGRIEELPVEGRWHALARGVARDELLAQQRALTAQVLAAPTEAACATQLQSWLERDDAALRFTLGMLTDMRSQLNMDYPTVSVAIRRLAQLAAAGC